MNTQTRLANLIQAAKDAGKKVLWLEVDQRDRASLIADIRESSGPLAKKMKMSGIDVALPELNGVPLRWEAPVTRPMLKEKPKKRK